MNSIAALWMLIEDWWRNRRDRCRISDNGSVSHRWACQFGGDCPATNDPRVKAAETRGGRSDG